MSDLAGVRAKVGRGKELLEAVRHERIAWVRRYPQPVTVNRDDKKNIDVFRWNIPDPPPDRIALLVGDAVHNLRASLDHLVWALSTTKGRTIPKGRQKDIEFPILRNPDFWESSRAKRLRYVEEEAVAIIEELQPYNGGNPPLLPYGAPGSFDLADYDPLLVLHKWDIIDKHRTLHTVGAHTPGGFIHPNRHGATLHVLYPDTVEHGTEIARINYFGPAPKYSEMDMHVQIATDVAVLEEPRTWGIRQSVGQIATYIDTVVGLFEPFF